MKLKNNMIMGFLLFWEFEILKILLLLKFFNTTLLISKLLQISVSKISILKILFDKSIELFTNWEYKSFIFLFDSLNNFK